MKKLISGGTIVNEGRQFVGSIVIDADRIADITEGTPLTRDNYDETIDATGCFVLPGVIDEHVHFRDPGLTDKADMESESRAAAYGGVTSFFDMPNTVPQTTTVEALENKFRIAKEKSHVNYSFFFGATNTNASLFAQLDAHRIPGIKLFMGASTGNMLVDKQEAREAVFAECARLQLPLMAHCEDTTIINSNMKKAKECFGDDPGIPHHEEIRSREACIASSTEAARLARKFGTRLHIAHISTQEELQLLDKFDAAEKAQVTGETTIAHLTFSNADYATLGALIKCNPSVKTASDRDHLIEALSNGTIATVGTDHAPHQLSQKQGGCARAASGMPLLQFSLVRMLELVDRHAISMEQLVTLMAHHPAQLFSIRDRGFLRKGYKADIAIVRKGEPWELTTGVIQSKCQWSPLLHHRFSWHVDHTFCNGHHIYNKGIFCDNYRGEAILFR